MFRVLIVDDKPVFRIALRQTVCWENFDCEIVADCCDFIP